MSISIEKKKKRLMLCKISDFFPGNIKNLLLICHICVHLTSCVVFMLSNIYGPFEILSPLCRRFCITPITGLSFLFAVSPTLIACGLQSNSNSIF